jgi:hypothetical protein
MFVTMLGTRGQGSEPGAMCGSADGGRLARSYNGHVCACSSTCFCVSARWTGIGVYPYAPRMQRFPLFMQVPMNMCARK